MENKIEIFSKRALEKSRLVDIKLPVWPDSKVGTPNAFLRSALFSINDCKKERIFMDKQDVASQGGVTISYTGWQLVQEDLSLWETLVNMAKESPLGYVCEFTSYEILKAMRLQIGGSQYDRLYDGVKRLIEGTVYVEFNSIEHAVRLIVSGSIDKSSQHYRLELDRKLIKLYNESTWIDVEQRIQLRRKSLAQFLHGYYSSHKSPIPIKVSTIHLWSGSNTKSLASFKQKLKSALEELVKIEFLDSYRIEGELVHVKRRI